MNALAVRIKHICFCQLAKSKFVRDIRNSLRLTTGNLNHLDIQKSPSNRPLVIIIKIVI